MSKEISPIDQARIEVPQTWYEVDHRVHIVSAIIYTLGLYFANLELFHVDSIPAHVVGAAIFFISNLADRSSTFKCFESSNLAKQHGVDLGQGAGEKNILLGDITTSRQFLLSKRALAIDILGIAAALTDPGIAAGFTIGKIHATANNLRVNKRLDRAIEIVDDIEAQKEEF